MLDRGAVGVVRCLPVCPHTLREFGTQQLGNWAIHTANMQFMALRLNSLWYADSQDGPAPRIRVRAEVSEIVRDTFPKWEVIHYDFPARGAMPPVTIRPVPPRARSAKYAASLG